MREDLNNLIFIIGLLCEELLQLRAEIFSWSKDVFPDWNGLSVGDPSADFRQSNQLPIQPEENPDSLQCNYQVKKESLTRKLSQRSYMPEMLPGM